MSLNYKMDEEKLEQVRKYATEVMSAGRNLPCEDGLRSNIFSLKKPRILDYVDYKFSKF